MGTLNLGLGLLTSSLVAVGSVGGAPILFFGNFERVSKEVWKEVMEIEKVDNSKSEKVEFVGSGGAMKSIKS